MAKLSAASIDQLAASLLEDFSVFLNTEYRYDIDELLANATRDFVDRELGELDGELAANLQLSLMNRSRIDVL